MMRARLYYYRNRYYHGQMGRFVSRDPIGYVGSPMNLYQYAAANPVVNIDPEGTAIIVIGGGIALELIALECATISGAFTIEMDHPRSGDSWRHCVLGCRIA